MEVTGLTETPALLVRLCMETGREIDPKFFLTVRNTEEAWHVECFERVTDAFGGRLTRPANRGYEAAFNRNLHRRVLDAAQHLDSYVACFCAFEDGLELELCRTWRINAKNPAIAAMLDHIVADKERHAAFGWLYLASRAPRWAAAECGLIAEQVAAHIRDTEFKGYHCPWLAPEHAAAEADADAACAAAGLGAASRAQEEDTMATYVANARQRFREMGVVIPTFETNRMRSVLARRCTPRRPWFSCLSSVRAPAAFTHSWRSASTWCSKARGDEFRAGRMGRDGRHDFGPAVCRNEQCRAGLSRCRFAGGHCRYRLRTAGHPAVA